MSAPFSPFATAHVVEILMQTFQSGEDVTPAQVQERVEQFLEAPGFGHLRKEVQEIVDEILRRIKVVIGAADVLVDDDDHIDWLEDADRSSWRLWPRLEDYIKNVEKLPPSVVGELGRSTELVLKRLESPDREGQWDRRGLVVGHVQSGKTTHYTALAAKALDSGYQIVIILSGIHNSLRGQTHERIDGHLIGRNSAALVEAIQQHGMLARTSVTGVGKRDRDLGRGELPFTILTCTTSAEDGDFRTNVANQVGFQLSSGSRLVLVVKKHKTILENLIAWLRHQNAQGRDQQVRVIPNPALIIDDEADHASINTAKNPETDATRINKLIRELLMSFRRVGFVGYTATPFANIFVRHDDNGPPLGPDLFPKSFIVSLQAPSDYIGPAEVFGHPGDESVGIPARDALPMHVNVDDSTDWIPDKHKSTWNPGALPSSLREAIRLYVCVVAARMVRGNVKVHNSMLIHATRFIDVQDKIDRQVRDEVDGLRNVLGMGNPESIARIGKELKKIWNNQIVKPHPAFKAVLGDRCDRLPAWSHVWSNIPSALDRVQVMRINGSSTDALAYSKTNEGLCVIAIGGDKLSRGLTLEGLSVSYFLRTSNMFDTLMQMGRWFGYRPGYADLCHVYTTQSLYSAFREISLAMDDLRADLNHMAFANKTPIEFGLRVREPSDGLVITAANKIRTGQSVQVRFAGTLVQALEIERATHQGNRNRDSVSKLIEALPAPTKRVRGEETQHHVWQHVNAGLILDCLAGYEALTTTSFQNRCEPLRRFITERVEHGELIDWTVVVVGKAGSETLPVGALKLPTVTRKEKLPGAEPFETQAVVGSAEEALDLDSDEWNRAMSSSPPLKSGGIRTTPDRETVRGVRPATRGLILIYLISNDEGKTVVPSVAISFPESETAKSLAYKVNRVWLERRGLTDEDDDVES
jgi:hypothetical protein